MIIIFSFGYADAGDYGTILINHGHTQFNSRKINGLAIKGRNRQYKQINIAEKRLHTVRNNDTTMVKL